MDFKYNNINIEHKNYWKYFIVTYKLPICRNNTNKYNQLFVEFGGFYKTNIMLVDVVKSVSAFIPNIVERRQYSFSVAIDGFDKYWTFKIWFGC